MSLNQASPPPSNQPPRTTPRAQVSYEGRRHARLTRSMKQLEPAPQKVLVELRYRLKDGESAPVSNKALANATGLSESYVSILVRQLAGETVTITSRRRTLTYAGAHQRFIERVWYKDRGDGFAGFVITMLPPPELRLDRRGLHPPSSAVPPPTRLPFLGDHPHDPFPCTQDNPPECHETPQKGDHPHDPSILSIHTPNQQTNHESPPNSITPRANTGGGGQSNTIESRVNDQPLTAMSSPSSDPCGGDCENIHHMGELGLDPLVIEEHKMLNLHRPIPPGEWCELLDLQHQYGAPQVLMWQARARRADPERPQGIIPAYYIACAARMEVDAYRPPRVPSRPPPEIAADGPAAPDPRGVPPPKPSIESACDALLTAMGIRERDVLAGVPLDLIQQWQAVLDHPGLAARFDDVRAFAHSQLAKQQPPPPRAELERWATRARERTALAPQSALTDEQLAQIHAQDAVMVARADALAPADLTDDERLTLLADMQAGLTDSEVLARLHTRRVAATAPLLTPTEVCQQLLERLQQPIHRALWPLLPCISLRPEGEVLRIVCNTVADLGVVEAEVARCIRGLLEQYSWQPAVRVVAQEVPPPPTDPHSAPPDWIALERWAELPKMLQAALLGATFSEGKVQCITPTLSVLVETRFAHELTILVAEVTDKGTA